MVDEVFPCPCCGHLTLTQPPGSYDVCPICFWEDDAVQLRWPTFAGGANGVSLVEAQTNYAQFGAMHQTFLKSVRRPQPNEPVENGWHPIVDLAPFEPWGQSVVSKTPWPDELTNLYWWRDAFWGRAE